MTMLAEEGLGREVLLGLTAGAAAEVMSAGPSADDTSLYCDEVPAGMAVSPNAAPGVTQKNGYSSSHQLSVIDDY